MTLSSVLAKIPASVKTHLRALAAVAGFAALHSFIGGGTAEVAVEAGLSAALPVLIKWLDPTETAYGIGS